MRAEEIVMRIRSQQKRVFIGLPFLLAVFLLPAVHTSRLGATGSNRSPFLQAVAYDTGASNTIRARGQTRAAHRHYLASSTSTTLNPESDALISPIFLPPLTYGTGGFHPLGIAVADVNGDGKPDVIVANDCLSNLNCNNEGAVGVLLGNGDGTFQPAVSYASGGSTAVSVAVADLNGDGKPDLVVANEVPLVAGIDGVLAVLFGNGDGTFQPAVIYDSGGYAAMSVAVADLNGDGKPDLVVANWSGVSTVDGTLGVLLGTGNGTFQPVVTYDTGGVAADAVAVADVNGDGKLDLLVANCECQTTSGDIGVLLGNGDGTFQPVSTYKAGPHPWSMAVADLNGDGTPDLVVGSLEADTISVLFGNRNGTLQPPAIYDSGGQLAQAVAIADINGDGQPDLVVGELCNNQACILESRVGVLLGNGDGTFQPAVIFVADGEYSYWVSSVVTADLNGDGRIDVVAAPSYGGGGPSKSVLSVLLNNTPFCTNPPVVTLSITPRSLWPPDGKMVSITVSGTINDPDASCSIKAAAYTVTDEYRKVQPRGPVTLGPRGAYSFKVRLQASRLGSDIDGRHYTITVGASNDAGKTGSQSGMVIVAHDRGH
jgi:hypothetical protein